MVQSGASAPNDAAWIPSKRLWVAIITTPMAMTAHVGRRTSADSKIIAQPSAQSTLSSMSR